MQAAGHSADEYHGDLTQQARERLLMRFRNKQVRWVITDIAARGLDVDLLTHVINYDLPDSVETCPPVVQDELVTKAQRFLWFRRLSDANSSKLNATCAKRKFFLFQPEQIEARQLERLQVQVREVLAGERLASYRLCELSEEYDVHAIAAAALQMAYDKTRPAWMQTDNAGTEEERLFSLNPS